MLERRVKLWGDERDGGEMEALRTATDIAEAQCGVWSLSVVACSRASVDGVEIVGRCQNFRIA